MAEQKTGDSSAAPKFTKENILSFEKYRDRRDLLSVLLEADQHYTTAEVDTLIETFMKGKVE